MQIHRTEPARNFTVLPNVALQDRRLSYTARGLLVDLLSRPDGWREDSRIMADTSVQGRTAVAKALRELIAAGYYRVVRSQGPGGRWFSVIHVYDTPQQAAPTADTQGLGGPRSGGTDALLKNQEKEPSLPDAPVEAEADAADDAEPVEKGPTADRTSGRTDEALAVLFRVIRPEPRLRLGQAEARQLAPLVASWLERGSGQADLAQALLSDLPATVHSALGMLRHRLQRKMPPVREHRQPAVARYSECGRCHDPVPRPGICRACAGLGTRTVAVGTGEAVTPRGVARVRAALRSARGAGLGPGAAAAVG